MPKLQYGYFVPAQNYSLRPTAICVATNLRNDKYTLFLGIVDTGADATSLSVDLLDGLGIAVKDLHLESIGGVAGAEAKGWRCDYIKISFIEDAPPREHFPSGDSPVPLHFITGDVSILGNMGFLELCKVCVDGRNKVVDIEF